mmetsp:Transcript_131872/g.421918  ORF Transcript_131872/g.421918 Transcript_131872/m.421918 type:complete len:320 (+) Transcript_131872:72-1031(+)
MAPAQQPAPALAPHSRVRRGPLLFALASASLLALRGSAFVTGPVAGPGPPAGRDAHLEFIVRRAEPAAAGAAEGAAVAAEGGKKEKRTRYGVQKQFRLTPWQRNPPKPEFVIRGGGGVFGGQSFGLRKTREDTLQFRRLSNRRYREMLQHRRWAADSSSYPRIFGYVEDWDDTTGEGFVTDQEREQMYLVYRDEIKARHNYKTLQNGEFVEFFATDEMDSVTNLPLAKTLTGPQGQYVKESEEMRAMLRKIGFVKAFEDDKEELLAWKFEKQYWTWENRVKKDPKLRSKEPQVKAIHSKLPDTNVYPKYNADDQSAHTW